jgi:hypothetical protein
MARREGYRMVIYEEFCQELESTPRQLFDFAGPSWDAPSQRFVRHLESSEARDASYFEVVRPPLAALDKWRDQLMSEQTARIEHIVCHAELGRRFLEGR